MAVLFGASLVDIWRVGNIIVSGICAAWALHLFHLTFLHRRGGVRWPVPVRAVRWMLAALAVNTGLVGYLFNSRLGDEVPLTWRTPVSSLALVVVIIAVTSFRPSDLIQPERDHGGGTRS